MAVFDSLSAELQKQLVEIQRHLQLESGEFLFRQGDVYRGFYLVQKGTLKLSYYSDDDHEITLKILQPDDMIAGVPIFLELETLHANCVAVHNSEVIFFEKNRFKSLMMKKPELMFEFAGEMMKFTVALRSKYLQLKLCSADERVKQYLFNIRADYSSRSFPVSKKEVAALLDMTPESLSRALTGLESRGVITRHGNSYKLTGKNSFLLD